MPAWPVLFLRKKGTAIAFNNLTARTDAQALIPEQVSYAILNALQGGGSAALRLFRNIPMSSNQTRFPILGALPAAYFVSGDTGLKQTTQASWANKYMNVEEVACIVPIPDNVMADARDTGYDIWGAMQPLVVDAIGRTLDSAVFFGVNKPASWPTAIVAGAVAAGNTVTVGTAAASGGIAEDINLTLEKVETDGFAPTGYVTDLPFRARLRRARDTTGQRLLDVDNGAATFDGLPVAYAMPALWPTGAGAAQLITGDFREGMIGVRQDITWSISNEAIIQDNTGAIIYNSFQQDLTLMRVVFRVGYQVSNSLNYANQDSAARFPFAVLSAA